MVVARPLCLPSTTWWFPRRRANGRPFLDVVVTPGHLKHSAVHKMSLNEAYERSDILSLTSNALIRECTAGFADFLARNSHIFPDKRQREHAGCLRSHAILRLRQEVQANIPMMVKNCVQLCCLSKLGDKSPHPGGGRSPEMYGATPTHTVHIGNAGQSIARRNIPVVGVGVGWMWCRSRSLDRKSVV